MSELREAPARAACTQQILGIAFLDADVSAATARMIDKGGLLVAPSGTCFERLREDIDYREAVTTADLAIADSGLMVMLWRLLRGRRIVRTSGLRYLQTLVHAIRHQQAPSPVLWVAPSATAATTITEWLRDHYPELAGRSMLYVAPMYSARVQDESLARMANERKPAHILIGIGAGPQEKLGCYLRKAVDYRPAIHCIGGALGMLTGYQNRVPEWADRLYLGWLLRTIAQPRVFLPRLARAWALPALILRYGECLPPLEPTRAPIV